MKNHFKRLYTSIIVSNKVERGSRRGAEKEKRGLRKYLFQQNFSTIKNPTIHSTAWVRERGRKENLSIFHHL
jgi:hypothetical protein